MKKAICALLAVMTLLSLSACGKKLYFDEEEYASAIAEANEAESASVSKQQEEISKDKDKIEKELGKTKKNKQIVAKLTYGDHVEYEAVYFDKDGNADYKLTYKYFDSDDYYERVVGYGDNGEDKIIDKDPAIRCITYKNKNIMKLEYQTYLDMYQRKSAEICTVFE